MANHRILVVEDEIIVAMGIKKTLANLGYEVAGSVDTGRKALAAIERTHPHLILMDIQLKGDMDGIETAARIRDEFNMPVIFLTAFSDSDTLERAKITSPYGYLIKPFQKRELNIAVDIALYKHKMERRLFESEQRFRRMAESIPDGITIIENGKITFVNDQACKLFGKSREELLQTYASESLGPDDGEDSVETEDTGDLVITPVGRGMWVTDGEGQRRCIRKRHAFCRKDGEIFTRYIITTDITEYVGSEDNVDAQPEVTRGTNGISHDRDDVPAPNTMETSSSVPRKTMTTKSLEDLMDFLNGFDDYAGIIRQKDHTRLKNLMGSENKAILVPVIVAGDSPLSKWLLGQAKHHRQQISDNLTGLFSTKTPPLFLSLSDDLSPPVFAVIMPIHAGLTEDLAKIAATVPFSILLTPEPTDAELSQLKILADSILRTHSLPLFLLVAHHDRYTVLTEKELLSLQKIKSPALKWREVFLGKQLMECFSDVLTRLGNSGNEA